MARDFVKSFRLNWGARLIVILVTLICMASLTGMAWLIFRVVDEVQERGLKDIIEEIWEGENE